MALTFNLRHVEKKNLRCEGELTPEELDVMDVDEMARLAGPLRYDLELERLSQSVLARGNLEATLSCHCVRCLRPFTKPLVVEDWVCDLPLEGEDRVPVVNDCVDLTPYLREDILLAFPQHPLCEPECRGLPDAPRILEESAGAEDHAGAVSPAWTELNKLKF